MRQIALILVLFGFILISCSSKTEGATYDQDYIAREYKLVFFQRCVQHGYKNPEFDTILATDVSAMGDLPLGLHFMRQIDSLVHMVGDSIVKDSVRRAVMFRGDPDRDIRTKRVMGICLDYYSSAQLDSLAHEASSTLDY